MSWSNPEYLSSLPPPCSITVQWKWRVETLPRYVWLGSGGLRSQHKQCRCHACHVAHHNVCKGVPQQWPMPASHWSQVSRSLRIGWRCQLSGQLVMCGQSHVANLSLLMDIIIRGVTLSLDGHSLIIHGSAVQRIISRKYQRPPVLDPINGLD